ncbi:MAG: nicotinamide-nucleotide amidase [Nitrosomonadales bacterium]|nr:nicotinamide-nucleotide amidase [Nitrosomonadales bacterium]
MDLLAAQLGGLLKAHGLTLATAESCTGGGVAQSITDVAGSSAWFERGFITYSNLAKQQMLGVSETTLKQYGAVSEATVREMVAGALSHSTAQIALAVSGIAGPGGGTEDKPVGTVWFAWGVKNGQTQARRHQITGNRAEVRAQSVHIALQGAINLLNQLTQTA